MDEKTGDLDLICSQGLSPVFMEKKSHFDGGSAHARMVGDGSAVFMTYAQILLPKGEIEQSEGLKAIAVIPVSYGGRVIACLNMASHSLKEIKPETALALETICGQMGAAIVRAKTAAALRESEDRWLFALEGSGDGVWDWDVATSRVFFSRQWKSMLGYGENEIGGRLDEWENRVHPDDHERIMREIIRHLAGESPAYSFEYRLRCQDGSYKWILDRGKVMSRSPHGRPLRVIGTHTDISERKRAEAALLESEERYRILTGNMSDMLWLMDVNFQTIYLSPSMVRARGYTLEEFQALPMVQNFTPASMEVVSRAMAEELTPERLAQPDLKIERTMELEFVRKDGTSFWSETTTTLIRDPRARNVPASLPKISATRSG